MWQSVEILNVYNTLTPNFPKNEKLQKTGISFLVESAKTENAPFSYKTTLSEANLNPLSANPTK